MRMLTGHSKGVRSVVYLPNGNLVSGSEDRTVRIWDGSTWESIRTIKALTPVYAMALSTNGNTLAFTGKQQSNNRRVILIRNYNIAEESFGKPFEFLRNEGESIWRLSYSSEGTFLIGNGRITGTSTRGGQGVVFSLVITNPHIPLNHLSIAHQLGAYSVRFADQDARVCITTQNKALCYSSIFLNEPTVSYDLRSMWNGDVIFLPDSPIAVVGGGKYLFFLDTITQSPIIEIKTGINVIHTLALSPDGRWLFVGGKKSGVEIYDTTNRTLRTRYEFEVGGVNSVAVAPTGETFAIGGDEGLAVVDCDF